MGTDRPKNGRSLSMDVEQEGNAGLCFQGMSWTVITRKRLFGIVLVTAAVFFLLAITALLFPNQVLCVDSGTVQADALVVLGGGSYERPLRAAELFREHSAPRIILTGAGDYETNKALLLNSGVPQEIITIESKSRSTKENAIFTNSLLRQSGAQRVILVTSWYHSRRALNCFRHYGPGIQFYSRPAYYAYRRSEWRRQGVLGPIRAEY